MKQVRFAGIVFFVIILIISQGEFAFSQATISFEGKTYVEEGGKWYLKVGEALFEVIPDIVTVKFRRDVSPKEKAQFYADHNTQVVRENKLGFADITVPPGKTPVEFVMELKATGMLDSAQVNTRGKYHQPIPNDPDFPDQWGLNNTGQTGGTPDADINAPEAWAIATVNPGIVVAVIDAGTEVNHEDLECNIWVNPGEDVDGDGVVWDPDDMNGVDDDGNGFIDDLVGWDFGADDNDVSSTNAHGTHVAGIVGACGNNSMGIIGVAGGFAPALGIRMMPLKVGTDTPNGDVLDEAIIYAADMGARVISMSLSVGQSDAIDAALDYAYNTMGVFINDASGNENHGVNYPATDPNVMAVGATDHDDVRKSPTAPGDWGSNFGPELEVVAPGVDICSTRLGNTYGCGGGTSYASPHVAGLAALMFSINPLATNVQVRQCITSTAEDQVGDPLEDIAGRDDYYGFGRINAEQALICIRPNQPPVSDPNGPYVAECAGMTTAVDLDGTGSSDPEGSPLTYVWSKDCPEGSFDDPTSATSIFTINTSTTCTVICNVSLVVTDAGDPPLSSTSVSTTVTVSDTTAPLIVCPADATIECDASSNPSATGTATATDSCDPALTMSNVDSVTLGACPGESSISRSWTATDDCGNASTCAQSIQIVDTTPPAIQCNAPSTIIPPDAPISFTATATDNCSAPSVEIRSFNCTSKKGRSKLESCVVNIAGDTISILDSGGVGDNISWEVHADDGCGNSSVESCSVLVVNPGKNK